MNGIIAVCMSDRVLGFDAKVSYFSLPLLKVTAVNFAYKIRAESLRKVYRLDQRLVPGKPSGMPGAFRACRIDDLGCDALRYSLGRTHLLLLHISDSFSGYRAVSDGAIQRDLFSSLALRSRGCGAYSSALLH